jgi:L-Ala-D/L-Glu epimerase
MSAPTLSARIERWPIAGEFRISRGAKTEAVVVVAELREGEHTARGECTPYARYGETPEGVLATIQAMGPAIANGLTRKTLQSSLPPGAARNALDCAFWDLQCKRRGLRIWTIASLEAPLPLTTAYTLSLDTPEAMAAKADAAIEYPLLKLKLSGEGDAARLAAIRRARPQARLIVDANEGFRPDTLQRLYDMCLTNRVELIEQPLPEGADEALARLPRDIPVCADESAHAAADVAALADRYDAVNIKLDKAGGLTEALAMRTAAKAAGLKIMVGCMIATSLSMAPALMLAQDADWVDLDGPLLLARDRTPGVLYDGSRIAAGAAELWG